MFNSYKNKRDTLGKFRIKAHLRSYVKDPIVINEKLLMAAVYKLNKSPYKDKDPSDGIAMELVVDAYCLGYFKHNDLTDVGCNLVRYGKYHSHHQKRMDRTKHSNIIKQRFLLT